MQDRQRDAEIASGRAGAELRYRSALARLQAARVARRQAACDLAEAEAERKAALASLQEIAAAEKRLRASAPWEIQARLQTIAGAVALNRNRRELASRDADGALVEQLDAEFAGLQQRLDHLRHQALQAEPDIDPHAVEPV